jgi:phage terminase large subunit-like protein
MSKIPQIDSVAELARFWDTHDLTDYEDEVIAFPRGAHDDMVDTASYAAIVLIEKIRTVEQSSESFEDAVIISPV